MKSDQSAKLSAKFESFFNLFMVEKVQSVLLLLIIATAIVLPVTAAHAEPLFDVNDAAKRQIIRFKQNKIDKIIETLCVTEGSTILDIGSGPGYASFLFAEIMHGKGEVFATDTNVEFTNYVAETAKNNGFNNIHPVLVNKKGLDVFYASNRYDLVFLSNSYHLLNSRIEYFKKLRGYLKPKARLVVIIFNQTPLLTDDELTDVDNLVKSLSLESDENPFVMKLSASSKILLKNIGNFNAVSNTQKNALIEDFNRMLTDPQFFNHFFKNSYFTKGFFTDSERELANWLLMTLKEDGVIDRSVDQIDAKAMRTVIKLNRLFFEKRFGKYLTRKPKSKGAFFPPNDVSRHTSKYVAIRELGEAGYMLTQEIKLSPTFDAVIFMSKTP